MAFLLCLLTRRQTSCVWRLRHKVFDVPKFTKAKKLSGVSTRTSSGFVPGHHLWLERDLDQLSGVLLGTNGRKELARH
jgi:hypothetical protein